MKLILTYTIYVVWESLHFIFRKMDYKKCVLPQLYVKLSFIPYDLIIKVKFDII
jgi:hypothetical protein